MGASYCIQGDTAYLGLVTFNKHTSRFGNQGILPGSNLTLKELKKEVMVAKVGGVDVMPFVLWPDVCSGEPQLEFFTVEEIEKMIEVSDG